MDKEIIGVIFLGVFFLLLMLKMRVATAMIVVAISGTYVLSLFEPHLRFVPFLRQFKSLLWSNLANYELSVIPLPCYWHTSSWWDAWNFNTALSCTNNLCHCR